MRVLSAGSKPRLDSMSLHGHLMSYRILRLSLSTFEERINRLRLYYVKTYFYVVLLRDAGLNISFYLNLAAVFI